MSAFLLDIYETLLRIRSLYGRIRMKRTDIRHLLLQNVELGKLPLMVGRCQWPTRGAQLVLWCTVLKPQTSKMVIAVGRAMEQDLVGPDLQSQPIMLTPYNLQLSLSQRFIYLVSAAWP